MATVETTKRDTTITVTLTEKEAKQLARILIGNVDWVDDADGEFAKHLYDKLGDAGISEDI